jgi:hypothetical protein
MKKNVTLFLACCLLVIGLSASTPTPAQDASIPSRFLGKWTQATPGVTNGGATLNITSVDSATGQLKGKWIPPSGPAQGKEFDIIGWVSSAPTPNKEFDTVLVVSMTVSLTTYGSITSYTGFLKDNKIIASWHNIRPVARYEWDHIVTGQDTFTKNPSGGH